jgi:hypothetical protein
MNTKTGCEVLRELWTVAYQNTGVGNPGVDGVPSRAIAFWQSSNISWSMQLAALKCWEERNSSEFPPLIINEIKEVKSSSSSSSGDQEQQKKRKN